MTITRALLLAILLSAFAGGAAGPAMAQACTKQGNDVTCDDGRRGIYTGDAIVWADGSQIAAGFAASERDHRQQIVRRHRPRRVRRSGSARADGADGESERAGQGALPDPGWRGVLFLRVRVKISRQ